MPEQALGPRPRAAMRPAARAAAAFHIVVLKLAPLAAALVVEPWLAASEALAQFRRKAPDDAPAAPSAGREPSRMHRHPHVMNAASNLLGICLIIIGGLKLSDYASKTWSDEVAWVAAFFMVASILCSYLGLRDGIERPWPARLADRTFLLGVAALILSMAIAAYQL